MSISYGGQAVLEGVMMRGPSVWSVAVRTPAGEVVDVTKSSARRCSATGSGAFP